MAENMALNRLLDILKESGADAWELTKTQERGWEFYLIRHALDQNRVKELESFRVKVYKKFNDCLGSAAAPVPADADDEEMKRIVAGLCQDATYVRNPFYTLNKPEQGSRAFGGQVETVDLKAISGDFLQTVAGLPETDGEDLNSCEIFVSEKRRRFMNSEGIDATVVYPYSMVEAVVNARKDGQEIELYRLYHCGTCDRDTLIQDLTETMRCGRDKLTAVPTPPLEKADVIFSTDASCEIYDYFFSRLSAGAVYRGISDWKIGDVVAPENMTMETAAFLPNSSENAAYDEEGARIRDMILINGGKAASYWGSRQFSQYLGLEDSFIASNFIVSGGKESAEEIRCGDYLEIMEFSDFQVDHVTGDIAGEIRLAYLHQGGKTISVSGGSVSGNMNELVKKMQFSAENRQYDCMLIPAVTRLNGATVTGAV